MDKCFVIQPFDKGVFDRRYEDVFAPAIRDAGLDPYRVDRDPSSIIPIDDIEQNIRDSAICLAEITLDNPNVWFELGYAIASQRPVCLLCSKERITKFPFDIQHRNIIHYEVGSTSDFQRLKIQIENRMKAMIAKEKEISRVSSLPASVNSGGLPSHEVAALTVIMSSVYTNPPGPSAYVIRQGMDQAGYTEIATSLALTSLLAKEMISSVEAHDDEARETYMAYQPTALGGKFLLSNPGLVNLRKPPVHAQNDAPNDW